MVITGTEGSVGSRVRNRWVRSKEDLPEVLILSLDYIILLRKEAGDLKFMSLTSNNMCMFFTGLESYHRPVGNEEGT